MGNIDLKSKVRDLLKKRKAIMLAHNYQRPEVQDTADLCGDSLELSIKAAQTDAKVIVFCGVHFMAETASIMSPEKTVLLPRMDAGCPMADMVTPEALLKKMKELPPMPVVTYVNSTAAVKALSTICCTSANVVKVVNSLDADEVLMVPDKNLAKYAALHTKKKLHFWDGYCVVHNMLTAEVVLLAKEKHPGAVFMAHPECRPEVLELADVVLSTSGMIRYAGESKSNSFIVGTETGILHPMKKANPSKTFYPVSKDMECRNMKKITLEDVTVSLENMTGEVKVPEDIRIPAKEAVRKMLELSISK
ncbi:MAG: quinolinate synthase [Thermodesulfobacteriota bacterium]|nr:quinolinate synthase [Thermodesulfobacteriota bacterium]